MTMYVMSLFSAFLMRPINFTNKLNKLSTRGSVNKLPIVFCNSIPISTSKTKIKSEFDASKAKLILELNFKSPDDALPFYKLPVQRLIHIYRVTKNDKKNGYCLNRVYYIASRFKCSPTLISECVSKRTFIYGLSFKWLESSLNALLDMEVPIDRILRDLWVIKYHHETIRERLQSVKDRGVDKLYPWMVRCSEDILNRSISISQETKDILGENDSTHRYLANRLNTSPDNIEKLCIKSPALKTIRVTKVKHFLDYLISEGYSVEDIASKLRILSASQKTVKQRLDTLRKLGLTQVNLNTLCKSKKDFKKYCNNIESVYHE